MVNFLFRGEEQCLTVGQRIKQVREKHGIPQKELSKRIGVSIGTVKRWERGGNPSVKAFASLYRALEIPMSGFWWGGEEIE